MKPLDLTVAEIKPILNHFPFNFYKMYKDNREELISNGYTSEKILSEKELVEEFKDLQTKTIPSNSVIFLGKKKVGFLSFEIIDYRDNQPVILYIKDLYIKKEYRRKNIGTVVLNGLIENFEGFNVFFYIHKKDKNTHKFLDKVINNGQLRTIEDIRCTIANEKSILKDFDKYNLKQVICY